MEASENKQFSISKIIRPVIIAVIVAGGLYYAYQKYKYNQIYETTDNAQIETHTAPIVSRVAGYVQAVNMEDFGKVKAGQLAIAIDASEAQLVLKELEADYKQALVDVQNADASYKSSQTGYGVNDESIKLIEIRLNKAKADLVRDQNLYNDKATTAKQLEDSKSNVALLEQQRKQAKEEKLVTNAKVDLSKTGIERSKAVLAVKKAKIDEQIQKINYTKIMAPISGKIGKKAVEIGQYVQPGQTLATVVNDSIYWVVGNFKETQIGRMQEGQTVLITMDSYPDTKIKGKILSFSDATGAKFALLPPDNSSGNFVKVTQRVPVKISIDDIAKYRNILKAGLSTSVEVKVK